MTDTTTAVVLFIAAEIFVASTIAIGVLMAVRTGGPPRPPRARRHHLALTRHHPAAPGPDPALTRH
jgi:hypothetical protein